MDEVLNITNLTFGYSKDKLIYKDFNLCVKRGEIVAILGESGSGKSTLFELICQNLKPISGEIKALKVSSIYQDPYSSFHPTYTIIEQIKDVVSNLDNLEELVKELGLEKDLLYSKPHQLSGGQLQRCSLLRGFLMKPDLLLVDEPTSALDNIIALQVMQLVMKFLHSVGILLITHDENLVKWCTKRRVDLNNNKDTNE